MVKIHADELRATLAIAPPCSWRQGIDVAGSPTDGMFVVTNL
jgi:hypothetical protein